MARTGGDNAIDLQLILKTYYTGDTATITTQMNNSLTGLTIDKVVKVDLALAAGGGAISFVPPAGFPAGVGTQILVFAAYDDTEPVSTQNLTVVNATATTTMRQIYAASYGGTTFTIASGSTTQITYVTAIFWNEP